MAEERVQRRLAAILAADVVGYSRMMSNDEQGTLSLLRTLRSEVFDPRVQQFGGRIFKTTGDGAMAEFGSAVDAVQCSVQIQRELAQRNSGARDDQQMALRIGVSLGDVVVDGDDLYGNGVNVAARMEGLAESGSICVSGNVQEQIVNTLDVTVEDLGEQRVKNIDRPIRCYQVLLEPSEIAESSAPRLPSDKPSVAVLPLENLSGDPEQEYFSDGITEDLITGLSRIHWLFIVSRNSTFSYKNQSPDSRDVARELGVRYVIEGSVRKAGTRVRLTLQLIDGNSGNQLWSERYDRELEDIFTLQDELSLTLGAAIEPELAKAERRRAVSRKPDNLDAWDCYHRGMHLWQTMQKAEIAEARSLFKRTMALDPNFAPAYAGFAITYFQNVRLGYSEGDKEEAIKAARRAVALDGEDPQSHLALGLVHLAEREIEAAIDEFEYTIELNPSLSFARVMLGRALIGVGRAENAIPHIEMALRLSPRDPGIGPFYAALGRAHLCLGQHDEAIKWAKMGYRHQNTSWPLPTVLASAFGHLGRDKEAQDAVQEMQRRQAGITLDFVREHVIINDPDYMDHIVDGLRKAGLPEESPEQSDQLPLPDKPSIAVLPFENMSGDPEQEYFSDGITEDIITALARIHWFFVIARNSSFSYKGTSPDIRKVAVELSVRYVLEGSVRKAGNRVRISAQLIDGVTGNHLWAERFDRELADIFAIQDEITRTVVGAIEPEITDAEIEKARRKPPNDLDAWDYYMRGMWHFYARRPGDFDRALSLFRRAVEIDPSLGVAYAWGAQAHYYQTSNIGSTVGPEAKRHLDEGFDMAKKAVALDDEDAVARASLGLLHIGRGEPEQARL